MKEQWMITPISKIPHNTTTKAPQKAPKEEE